MKRISMFFIVISSLFPLFLSGQSKPNYVGEWYQSKAQGKSPVKAVGFDARPSDFARTKRYNLRANINQLNSLMNTKPELVEIKVPYGNKIYTLNLARIDVVEGGFEVNTAQGKASHNTGVQYRGIVDGNPAHVASVSLMPSDKSMYFSTDEGNFVVTEDQGDYIIYNDQIMGLPITILCETPDETIPVTFDPNLISGVGCKTVKVYFECDYAFYQSKGSNIDNVTDYVIGFFNQVATLYAIEDIAIQISAMYVWTSPDPYISYNTPSAILGPFRTNRGTSFNGNIAHFLTTRNIGGGVAYVNALCNKAYAYGVSRIYTTYSNVPVYSWTINVVAHELGHTIASPHTHSCTWSGGALDNCAAPEGTCSPGPAPTNGGTVMSYCHMTSYGINFNNGFGTQPGNLLRSRVQNATCLPVEAIATPPSNLTTTNITSTSATLNWSPAPGAYIYTVQYKLATATTWTSAGTTTTTSKAINGLTSGSNYVWTVKADCSPFATNASFTTSGSEGGCSPPSGLSTTNITQTGATLNWTAVSGATSYTIQYKVSTGTTWTTVTSTTTSKAITGLSSGTSYVWQVKANCSAYSTQLTFSTTSSSSCSAPTGLSASSITQTGATLSWSPVSGATSYTVQYKVSTGSTWTTVTATTTSRVLTGLIAGTTYVWQVKANCSGYSTQSSFTTTSSSGCSPPTNLNTTSIYQTGATLSWSPVSGATSYTVQYKPSTGTTWTTVTSTTTSRTLTGLSSGTSYVWKVKANCSAYSAQVTFTTTGSISGCNTPTNLNTINITTNSATLTWTGPSNAQYYTIRIKPVGFGTWTTYNYITGNTFQVGNLQSRQSYEWYIRTRCTNGLTSSYSAPRTFTTL